MEITYRTAGETLEHEGLVQEAYRDSVGVWTWSVGVTSASGHLVHPRYKDNPQPIRRCLEVFIWLLERKYAPEVRRVFRGHDLTEAQFAAALSFHYNTGAIARAAWVDLWKAQENAAAYLAFMNWRAPAGIVPRRKAERDLFFKGKWTWGGKVTVFPVRKPSYRPNFDAGKQVDVSADLRSLLSGAA